MADFVQSLTSAAVAGQQQRIDLIGNDVLTLTNHITEMASMIASGSIDANRKQYVTRLDYSRNLIFIS